MKSIRIDRRAALTLVVRPPGSLVDLFYEGFHALFLLKRGCGPSGTAMLADKISSFLAQVDQQAKQWAIPPEQVHEGKYAFCAAVDEIVLGSSFAIKPEWETRPLQLRLFGDQLAGEHFFHKLEDLRASGSVNLHALEVFHLCLLLGFRGRYALDQSDRLNYLSARLGEEIARMRGKTRAFAPRAARPDNIANSLHRDLSMWMLSTVFMLAGLSAYLGFHLSLSHETNSKLGAYPALITLPPQAPNISITLP